jgi:hypothetical protein
MKELFGRNLSDQEIAGTIGALDGATIVGDIYGDRVRFEISHPHIKEQARQVFHQNGYLQIYNEIFRAEKKAPKGTGLESFARQAVFSQKYGVDLIKTNAAGSYELSKKDDGWNGYYTWARFGYNAKFTDKDLSKFPPLFRNVKDLNDLFSQPNGWLVWKYHGTGRKMIFDLTDGSSSWDILKNYLQKKGYKLEL